MDQKRPKKGRAMGGLARAEALSAEERQAIARKGATARWGLKATHRGNFEEEFGIDVDCYVLDDEQKTAVISQSGMGRALGLPSGGSAFPRFLATKAMVETVGGELREKLENPLKFQWGVGGAGSQPPSIIYGFDATLLIDICKAIAAAEATGTLRNRKAAQQARVVLTASAKAGIKGLVYALAGYDATKEETIAAFKFFVREEAREYEKEFPNQLYDQWYRLYSLPRPERGGPWKFQHLTVEQVYWPLARSSGKILELTRTQKAKSKDRTKKLHQFLSDIGVKALRQHLGQLLGMAQVSKNKGEYERHFNNIFGREPELPLEEST